MYFNRLPHFTISKNNDSDAIYSYCGNCLSNNIEMNGYVFKLDENKKCKCLNCGWTGTLYETINMTLQERKKLN